MGSPDVEGRAGAVASDLERFRGGWRVRLGSLRWLAGFLACVAAFGGLAWMGREVPMPAFLGVLVLCFLGGQAIRWAFLRWRRSVHLAHQAALLEALAALAEAAKAWEVRRRTAAVLENVAASKPEPRSVEVRVPSWVVGGSTPDERLEKLEEAVVREFSSKGCKTVKPNPAVYPLEPVAWPSRVRMIFGADRVRVMECLDRIETVVELTWNGGAS